ncbi:cutaneous T-cell lymphoma tumor antigen se70-2 [Aphelenchoides avenae]|nr:cutaneous T-cell lymphoma tumor antigen se70-2 [Aphelenchus avenae]
MKVVLVHGCDLEHHEQLVTHMEKFGDLFDIDIPQQGGKPIVFTYKDPYDAQKAVNQAGSFDKCNIRVEWAPVSFGQDNVIPDTDRKPDERVTPAALLASLGDDDDSDAEEQNEDAEDRHEAVGVAED